MMDGALEHECGDEDLGKVSCDIAPMVAFEKPNLRASVVGTQNLLVLLERQDSCSVLGQLVGCRAGRVVGFQCCYCQKYL